MTDKPIEKGWQEFRMQLLIPVDAGETQTVESRRAFFAGAVHTFYLVADKASELSERDALKFMDSIKAEFDQYARDLVNGKA